MTTSGAQPSGPPRLSDHDPAWTQHAADLAGRLAAALSGRRLGTVRVDHIGSTAVAGLPAKPFVDLQVRCETLPTLEDVADWLAPLGWTPHRGSRPDSPGVSRDSANGRTGVPDDLLAKHLLVRPGPPVPAILHVRLMSSPFAQDVLRFRDALRIDAGTRAEYAELKRRLADEHADDPDYDDYTRAKTAFVRAALARSRSSDE